tara:strand:- start:7786 stop:8034 length:249 start_codon:yes stop_codon:yes gene_type:complete
MHCKDAITGEKFNDIIVGTFGEKRLLSVRSGDHEEKLFFGPADNKESQLQRYQRWKTSAVTCESNKKKKKKRVKEVMCVSEL